jgi:hypothetical protein
MAIIFALGRRSPSGWRPAMKHGRKTAIMGVARCGPYRIGVSIYPLSYRG